MTTMVSGAAATELGVADIKRLLPHRYPMLLVDRVTDLVPDVGLTAYKAVTVNEPWYRERAEDGDPAYPPVLLIESWCQAAGVLAACARPNPDVLRGQVMLFGGMSDVEFLAPVLPGTLLEHRVRLLRDLGDTVLFEGESLVGGEPVLRVGRVVMAMRPATELSPESGESQ